MVRKLVMSPFTKVLAKRYRNSICGLLRFTFFVFTICELFWKCIVNVVLFAASGERGDRTVRWLLGSCSNSNDVKSQNDVCCFSSNYLQVYFKYIHWFCFKYLIVPSIKKLGIIRHIQNIQFLTMVVTITFHFLFIAKIKIYIHKLLFYMFFLVLLLVCVQLYIAGIFLIALFF